MKQETKSVEVAEVVDDDGGGFTRRPGPRGRYVAAYRAGHRRTVHIQVGPEVFLSMTPAGALTEADAAARSGRINLLERTITVQYLSEADPPAWRVDSNLQTRTGVHDGDVSVPASASDTTDRV